MMKPGYYVVTREAVLAAENAPYRIRLHKRDWLVTDGAMIGRFDKEELDWVPLEWVRGAPVSLDETVNAQIDPISVAVAFQKLVTGFQKLVFVEEGELVPDMPKPSLMQLEAYLRERRMLLACSYRRHVSTTTPASD